MTDRTPVPPVVTDEMVEAAWKVYAAAPVENGWKSAMRDALVAANMQAAASGEVERLRAALTQIDALDPEWQHIEGLSFYAAKGIILRMGEIARQALGGSDEK